MRLRTTIGRREQEWTPAEEIRRRRVQSARRCHDWTELDSVDLVPRGRRFLVHAETDEVFVPYPPRIRFR